MITINIPEWIIWLAFGVFLTQWILNGVLAYYKAKCALSWDRLDEATKKALGGKVMPRHAKF